MRSYLSAYAVDAKADYTHTSMNGGKWKIPNEVMDEFYEKYTECLLTETLYLTEKHKPLYSQIVVDLDFKFAKKTNPRPLSNDVIIRIVEKLTCILKTILQDHDKKHNYMCVILQRPDMYLSKEYYKDGLHIQFPYIVCNYECHYALRNMFIQDFVHNLDCIQENDNAYYDSAVIEKNNWTLFGSTKPNMNGNQIQPYAIKKIMNSDVRKSDLTLLKWTKLLSIRNRKPLITDYDNNLVMSNLHTIQEKKEYNQERIQKHPDHKNKPDLLHGTISMKKNRSYDIAHCKDLLNILSPERCNNYLTWITVGFILHYCQKTDKNDNNYLPLWKSWSKKSAKYNEDTCVAKWNNFEKSNQYQLSYSSLIHFAKLDNMEEYKNLIIKQHLQTKLELVETEHKKITKMKTVGIGLMFTLDTENECMFDEDGHDKNNMYIVVNENKWCIRCHACTTEQSPKNGYYDIPNSVMKRITEVKNDEVIYDMKHKSDMVWNVEYNIFPDTIHNILMYVSLNSKHRSVANVYYHLRKDKYAYCGSDVYKYNGHGWKKLTNDATICNDIETLIRQYDIMLTFYNEHKNIPLESKRYVINLVRKIGVLLNDESFIGKLYTCIKRKYDDVNFFEKLDDNKLTLGFEDGTYDCIEHKFRHGKPDDYISKCVGYKFPLAYSKNKNQLMKFLKDILPNESVLNYVLRHISTCLIGNDEESICLVCSGESNNGKSVLKNLIMYTLGDYVVSYSSDLLQNKKPSASAPCEALKDFYHARCAIGVEPEAKLKINSSFFKSIIGGDAITVRGLYEKNMTFKPTHKMFLMCNTIPMFDVDEPAIWKRVRCVEFPTRFVKNPTKPNEKKIDTKLDQKIFEYKQDFMLLLIEKLKEYQLHGNPVPKEVEEFTEKYKNSYDMYYNYLMARTEKSDNNIHLRTLYNDFKLWFKEDYPEKIPPSLNMFTKGLRKHYPDTHNIMIDGVQQKGIKKLKLKTSN